MEQFRRDPLTGKGRQHDLQPGLATMFHGGHAISVVRDQGVPIDNCDAGGRRKVETDLPYNASLRA
jgi:hypothetical protein